MSKKKEIPFIGVLVFVAVLIIVMSVSSVRAVATGRRNHFDTLAAEREYVGNLKEILAAEMIFNPGVNVSRVTTDGKFFEYLIGIYAPGYYKLSDAERENLVNKLEQVGMDVDNATIEISFLELIK